MVDENTKQYAILDPRELRPKKVCIRDLPCYKNTKLIVDSLNEHIFTVTSAAMLKNRKTGNPVPLYMVNVLPCKNFEKIYLIKLIHSLSINIKAFNNKQRVKQFLNCRGFGHASDVCRFDAKCVKCEEFI